MLEAIAKFFKEKGGVMEAHLYCAYDSKPYRMMEIKKEFGSYAKMIAKVEELFEAQKKAAAVKPKKVAPVKGAE